MTHTPGPWTCHEVKDGRIAFTGSHCLVLSSSEHGMPTDADAALISAAPELLEACKAAIGGISDSAIDLTIWQPIISLLLQAISKAEGEKWHAKAEGKET